MRNGRNRPWQILVAGLDLDLMGYFRWFLVSTVFFGRTFVSSVFTEFFTLMNGVRNSQ
jgi:hypothetical protein